jgi:DNA recombination protein RmuC
MNIAGVLVTVLAVALGVAAGLLVARARARAAGQLAVAAAVAQAEARGRAAVAQAESEGRAAVAAAQAAAREATEEAVRLGATLDAERAAAVVSARERQQVQTQAEARLREAFDSLAGEALRRNNEAFAELAAAKLANARTTAEHDLSQRQQAIEAMVGPMRDSLDRVQAQVTTVEKERAGAHAQLLEQIATMRDTSDRLRTDTMQLVTALRAPQVRGRWGEMQLERAVEAAGMTEHIDFELQPSVNGPEGKLRPDLVVRLVGGKNIVVDSKVAFSGYLEAMEATDEAARNERFKAHARHLRSHIDQLGAKAYFEHFSPSPEFVVCFVPADAFLDAALREDPTLQERAFDQNVVLATPSTLVALLRTIAYSWRQEALAANAAEVHKLGRELYQRLSTMGGHIDKLGSSLTSAVGNYNKAVTSLESRVFVTARKMVDLKVVDVAEQLTAPRQLTETTRTLQAAEVAPQRLVSLPKPHGVPGQAELPTGAGGDPAADERATS